MEQGKSQSKKKVYVETTVVSDATALPTNDLTLAGRHDATLEEIWRIKREIAEEYPDWDSYIAGIYAFQEERKRGVKFVSFPSRKPEPATV